MPKLMWVSPFNLHDTSSGAAMHCQKMLSQLVKRGVEVLVIGGFVFDSEAGALSTFPKLKEEIQKDHAKQNIKQINDGSGVKYFYVPTHTTRIGELTHDEEWRIFSAFLKNLAAFAPDVVMGYGVGCFGMAVHAECKRRGIPHAYPICNGNHPFYNFWDCDLLFTDSQANKALYAKRDRLNLATTGAFIDKDHYIATGGGSHEYITMINPEPRKGGAIFAKLALIASKDPELKNEKFLVVNSRGHFGATIKALHDGEDKEARNYTHEMFANVSMAANTKDMKSIYALTKVLIAPSVPKAWHEGWGRVASEAVLNRIPALVAKNGGLEEAMAGAGIALEVPSALHDDPTRMPTDEEIAPWLSALKELLKVKNRSNLSHPLATETTTTSVIASEQSERGNLIKDTTLTLSADTTTDTTATTAVIAKERSDRGNLTQEPRQFTFDEWREAESPEWRERFDRAAQLLDIERSTDRAMDMLAPLFAKRASQNPHIMLQSQMRLDNEGKTY